MSVPAPAGDGDRSAAAGRAAAGRAAVERAAAVLGDRARRQVPLGPLTTYRVGGPAALLLEAGDEDDLRLATRAVVGSGVAVLVVGRGSNLLVADAGFPGLAVVLGERFAAVRAEGTTVRAGGAASLPVVARRTAALALAGMEWAVGVPGSVGGAVRMNAGGHGSDMSRHLVAARVVDLAGGPGGRVPASGLALGYRRSSVTGSQVVVEAELELAPGDRAASEARIADIVAWRRRHQPGGPNAGSVFTNPEGDSAGRLVEAAGLKGWRRGSAFVSPKHANFIQADDGGSADDVRDLILEVGRLVEDRSGVRLQPELRMVGFGPEPSTSTGG
ncbi:MAG: UDP-N-acetylmuramate dehydrogenase [Actinobacteria bacterium]|nr:UDP-N-acetylmuramate dehydrogenase [Actinomycetota bacterium]